MKTCRKCEIEKPRDSFNRDRSRRDGLHPYCQECKRSQDALYASKHREEAKERASAWYYANRERAGAATKAYREKNAEAVAARQREYRDRNRERLNAQRLDRWHNDPEFRARHQARVGKRKRRDYIYERDGGICHICDRHVPRAEMTLDHLIPLKFDGPDTNDNLRTAHSICNSRRGAGRLPAQLLLVG